MSKAGTRTTIEIVRITPTTLEKGLIWFEKNTGNLKKEAKKITSWWANNLFEIQENQKIYLSELTRRLTDWGYTKTNNVRNPGEFAQHGGIVDIFPINYKHAAKVEFEGNYIRAITPLDTVQNTQPEEKLKKVVTKEPGANNNTEEDKQKLKSLHIGSFVVHIDHGIAKFGGITEDEYILLEYAEGDKLEVPVSAAHKIDPYIGFGTPKLTRLGGNIWNKIKRKVKEDLIKTAKELAAVYAKREMAKRPPYKTDSELGSIAEETFEHSETSDQLKAIEDIKKDLSRDIPMDRVICGDVGFGKTEAAIRAAMFAVGAGYQVAFITPTTVLAHQHYKTFKSRLNSSGYPVRINRLTRIEKPGEQKEVIEKINNHKTDVVIGTHRLIQKDINFKKLGLFIIDEEQRFGVKQKEYFKNRRAELDVLSLSATPIPRTMHLALSGMRDMSIINTPPYGRKPIKTEVAPYEKKLVKKAIEYEMARGGQVYFLHNKISSLPKTAKELRELCPEAKTDFLHAKLPEEEIIQKIDNFEKGNIDVLVTTTIMENGLDMQKANTLICDNAAKLGLAQAHQVRGRIGRGNVQAYAYFLYPSHKLPEKAKERLEALKNAQRLGAGYEIAMRDLEIRGAGNILGKEQSGSIAKVGFNLYLQLLNEAIEELRSSNHNIQGHKKQTN